MYLLRHNMPSFPSSTLAKKSQIFSGSCPSPAGVVTGHFIAWLSHLAHRTHLPLHTSTTRPHHTTSTSTRVFLFALRLHPSNQLRHLKGHSSFIVSPLPPFLLQLSSHLHRLTLPSSRHSRIQLRQYHPLLLTLPRTASNKNHRACLYLFPPRTHPRPAFGLLKGNASTTAPPAVSFVSDKDFSLRKTSHIINVIPPPAAAVAFA
ncbi:hypothetical protein BGZ61DRAFT_167497 [Ilyonectria robusta]|uniref:uncharacterized protein n=1 Tax=Ilyonectria robusta TaxID=1079257 RepID=UPI001E8E0A4A|nr:uncharacterized protein BGZ61DRAFT_167497 [Ilyonectria robusta]KAH8733881.1 hypothetical protein BGZ61DRAFT_167497 [Ilyonectria robusta]